MKGGAAERMRTNSKAACMASAVNGADSYAYALQRYYI